MQATRTLLDTGVNHGHPLLALMVDDGDRHTVEPGWGHEDANGHGTELAGLALFGDLTPTLSDEGALSVPHRLESVKILQGPGDNDGQSYGAITAEAVARVEITAQDRRRVFAMAVSSTDGRDRGRPSSWSAEVDRLACDYDGQGETPRLFVLCAGNTQDPNAWGDYPASLSTNLVHDPGQAWNALTVGAYSELTTISEAFGHQYTPIAAAGGLSPYTPWAVRAGGQVQPRRVDRGARDPAGPLRDSRAADCGTGRDRDPGLSYEPLEWIPRLRQQALGLLHQDRVNEWPPLRLDDQRLDGQIEAPKFPQARKALRWLALGQQLPHGRVAALGGQHLLELCGPVAQRLGLGGLLP